MQIMLRRSTCIVLLTSYAFAIVMADAAHAQARSAKQAEKAAPKAATTSEQAPRVANYRPVGPDATTPAVIPPVQMSKQHEALNSVKVGDKLPAISLNRLGDRPTRLGELFGRTATVVAFWRADRRASRTLLADLGPDVIEPFRQRGVAVVGVAVQTSEGDARATLEKAAAQMPTLLDADGQAFAQVGKERLPRVYLVDGEGKILWFDIDYSLATRRELNQALRAVTSAAATR
jgi:peroxiredoxin